MAAYLYPCRNTCHPDKGVVVKPKLLTIAFMSTVTAILGVCILWQVDKMRMRGPGYLERGVSALETIAAEEQKQTELMR